MEPLTTPYPLKYSVPKARVFLVFLSMFFCTAVLCLLQLRFFKPKTKDFYSFEIKDSRGRIVSLEKYRGKVSYDLFIYEESLEDNETITREKESLKLSDAVISDSSKKEPRWNFWKYLVSPEGKVVKFWRPEEPIEGIKPEIASLIRQIIMKKREDL
ncbi:hypothetical protein ASZ78_000747 [Callipepla squamata]|uniref:Glutathione peroxidase n=1 Tax=Callipepla squamata TaxID=9009 RepID=A0A226MKP4_CALSU|nr:hypothetical protein ASZ78_000747 [Callipepla squamata]